MFCVQVVVTDDYNEMHNYIFEYDGSIWNYHTWGYSLFMVDFIVTILCLVLDCLFSDIWDHLMLTNLCF